MTLAKDIEKYLEDKGRMTLGEIAKDLDKSVAQVWDILDTLVYKKKTVTKVAKGLYEVKK